MQKLIYYFRILLFYTILLGVFYPFCTLTVSKNFFPYQANGSLLTKTGAVVGSRLIAQSFTQPHYFHSRYSVINYDATNSGSSNLAPSNPLLFTRIRQLIQHIRKINQLPATVPLPADMVLTSASGLDPDISWANAQIQLPRVATARHLTVAQLQKLLTTQLQPDFYGLWGNKTINVLQLNLLLDQLYPI